MSEDKGKKRKRRLKKLDLASQVDQQLLYQLQIENMAIDAAFKLEQYRIRRRMHNEYVA